MIISKINDIHHSLSSSINLLSKPEGWIKVSVIGWKELAGFRSWRLLVDSGLKEDVNCDLSNSILFDDFLRVLVSVETAHSYERHIETVNRVQFLNLDDFHSEKSQVVSNLNY